MSESVRGLGEACRALEAPIVGGNVSLYNEGATGPVYPTPVIGMVGRLPEASRAGRLAFQHAGDEIALVGPFAPALGASELDKLLGEPLPDGLPAIPLEAVIAAQAAVRDAVREGALASAHDIAEGGLAVALAECCLAGDLGAAVALGEDLLDRLGPADSSPHAASRTALFGEGPGAFLVSGASRALAELARRTPVARLGTVGGKRLSIALPAAELSVSLGELGRAHARLRELFA
jgi:phosphoribosylformylglycinamidine synthase